MERTLEYLGKIGKKVVKQTAPGISVSMIAGPNNYFVVNDTLIDIPIIINRSQLISALKCNLISGLDNLKINTLGDNITKRSEADVLDNPYGQLFGTNDALFFWNKAGLRDYCYKADLIMTHMFGKKDTLSTWSGEQLYKAIKSGDVKEINAYYNYIVIGIMESSKTIKKDKQKLISSAENKLASMFGNNAKYELVVRNIAEQYSEMAFRIKN